MEDDNNRRQPPQHSGQMFSHENSNGIMYVYIYIVALARHQTKGFLELGHTIQRTLNNRD